MYKNSAFQKNGIRKKKMNFKRTLFDQTTSSLRYVETDKRFVFCLTSNLTAQAFKVENIYQTQIRISIYRLIYLKVFHPFPSAASLFAAFM
jgi:hypothetical protein